MKKPRRARKNRDKYFCLNCLDRNYLIECADGCGQILFRYDKFFTIRKYIKNHIPKGNNNPFWKGGRIKTNNYYYLTMPDYFSSNKQGRVLEHVYFYQEKNKLCMLDWGDVHHIIPVTKDYCNNMPWNLQGMMKSEHSRLESTGRKYELVDMNGRRCSDPECLNPNKIHMRRFKDGRLRPNWKTDGKGNIICPTCYMRKKRREGKNNY